jgi:hypothetical protein
MHRTTPAAPAQSGLIDVTRGMRGMAASVGSRSVAGRVIRGRLTMFSPPNAVRPHGLLALALGVVAAVLAGPGCAAGPSHGLAGPGGRFAPRFAKCYPGMTRAPSTVARIEAASSLVIVAVGAQNVRPYARVVDVEPGVCDLTVFLTYNAYTSVHVPLRFYAERGGTYSVQAVVDEHHKTWLPIVTDTRSDEAALVLDPAAPRPSGSELRNILEMHRHARERAVQDPSDPAEPGSPTDPSAPPPHPDSEGFHA